MPEVVPVNEPPEAAVELLAVVPVVVFADVGSASFEFVVATDLTALSPSAANPEAAARPAGAAAAAWSRACLAGESCAGWDAAACPLTGVAGDADPGCDPFAAGPASAGRVAPDAAVPLVEPEPAAVTADAAFPVAEAPALAAGVAGAGVAAAASRARAVRSVVVPLVPSAGGIVETVDASWLSSGSPPFVAGAPGWPSSAATIVPVVALSVPVVSLGSVNCAVEDCGVWGSLLLAASEVVLVSEFCPEESASVWTSAEKASAPGEPLAGSPAEAGAAIPVCAAELVA